MSPLQLSVDYWLYRHYIRRSKGEFTVAKDQYVRLNTGWFSDRSACYLAAGRPVITQETGFTQHYGAQPRFADFSFAARDCRGGSNRSMPIMPRIPVPLGKLPVKFSRRKKSSARSWIGPECRQGVAAFPSAKVESGARYFPLVPSFATVHDSGEIASIRRRMNREFVSFRSNGSESCTVKSMNAI